MQNIFLGTPCCQPGQQPGIQGDRLDEQWLSQAQGIRVQNHDFTLWVAEDIAPLQSELNRYRLLSLLQQRVSRSRNALGNLAHEMKRPLQQLQLLAEQLDPQHQQQQREALQRLRQLVERELKRARIVGMSSPGRQTKLSEDLPPLLQVLQQLYPQVRLQAHYPQSGVLPQDRDDMLELLGNLLDNACKYASGEILLSVRHDDKEWLISVCDQGPGIAAEARQQLLLRGTRLDESGPQGSGLGLAMVSDIVASYSGSLQLRANQPQGLCVIVTLPATAGR